jgi:hypothetical protein
MLAEEELQRELTFWQGDLGFGLSRPKCRPALSICWSQGCFWNGANADLMAISSFTALSLVDQ